MWRSGGGELAGLEEIRVGPTGAGAVSGPPGVRRWFLTLCGLDDETGVIHLPSHHVKPANPRRQAAVATGIKRLSSSPVGTTSIAATATLTPADVAAHNIVAISNLPDTASETFHVTRDDYSSLGEVTEILGDLT